MSDHIGEDIDGRRRVHGRPGRLPFDPVDLGGSLLETLGPIGARRHIEAVAVEIRAAITPTELVVALADIANRVDAADEVVISRVVALLTGNAE